MCKTRAIANIYTVASFYRLSQGCNIENVITTTRSTLIPSPLKALPLSPNNNFTASTKIDSNRSLSHFHILSLFALAFTFFILTKLFTPKSVKGNDLERSPRQPPAGEKFVSITKFLRKIFQLSVIVLLNFTLVEWGMFPAFS